MRKTYIPIFFFVVFLLFSGTLEARRERPYARLVGTSLTWLQRQDTLAQKPDTQGQQPDSLNQQPDSLNQKTAYTKEIADSLAALLDSSIILFLDSLQLPYTEAYRVPAMDSSYSVVRDEEGLFYRLDSVGLMVMDNKNQPIIDSLKSYTAQTLANMALMDSLGLPVADTIRIPVRDSSGQVVRDSLGFFYVLDSLQLITLDTLNRFMIDSLATFTEKEMKRFGRLYKREQKQIADSIRHASFQMLETYMVPDSLRFQRLLSWTYDASFNDITFKDLDTNINDNFYDYAFYKEDVGATYLGVAGSPAITDNYFKRRTKERFSFWDAGMYEAYDRETLPNYNTKSAYTVMAYSGTLFSNKEIEESNVSFLHTQNFSPSTNVQFYYQRRGAAGLLEKEATDTRTLALTANHIGKRYVMHAGYIRNKLSREENGGISDDFYVMDTIVESRAVPITLSDASSLLKSQQLYLTQSLGVPIRIFKNDTLEAGRGTMMYVGHSSQWSTMSRTYNDNIALNNTVGRAFYHDAFFMNPTATSDSVRTMILDNRAFLRLQPWSDSAIVSKVEGGVGYEILSNYNFRPSFYTTGNSNNTQNNMYVYAGASGRLSKYFQWNANGRFDFAGYYMGDMMLDAKARFSVYPNPEGIHLTGRFYVNNHTPDWYAQHYYSNHFVWENNFSKITDTRIEANLDIPRWKFQVGFSYGLLSNGTYYDTLGIIRQAENPVNIMTASITKNFKLWLFHLDHSAIVQLSSNQELFPLPLVSAHLRYYLEIPAVKNVMTVQIGADATFHTKYFVYAYNPALGAFHLQNEKRYGGTPYIDAFVNFKWKRATIFAKYVNVNMGWPTSDYYSAAHYIRPQRVLKLGMTWPFYLRPGSGSSSSNSGNASGSNNSSGMNNSSRSSSSSNMSSFNNQGR